MNHSVPSYSPPHALTAEADGRDDTTAAYRAAVRHTRRVRLLRWLLPAVLIAGVLALLASAWIDPLRLLREFPLEFAKLAISGNKLTITAPKVTGFTRDGRAYNMTAETASQDLRRTGALDLTGVVAELEMANGGSTKLTAKRGNFEAKEERIELYDGVEIQSTNGFTGRLKDAIIDVRKRSVVTKQPVDLRYQDGRITANRLEIFDNGTRAVFDGGVTTWLRLAPPTPAPAPAAPTPAPTTTGSIR